MIKSATSSSPLLFYFEQTGFDDLMPLAELMACRLGFNESEMIEAVCLVYDKFRVYPPTKNRCAWFLTVFREKLYEARIASREFHK